MMLFNRQKVMLTLLQEATRTVGRIELMKWAFLLRNDMPSEGGTSFYGFVPYHYGPFSFCLQREMIKLAEMGFVRMPDDISWGFADGTDISKLVPLESDILHDIRRIVERFAPQKTTDTVMKYVYERFPEYTIFSKRRRLASRPEASIAIYTVGYEGLSADEFLNMLVHSGIRRLIDVRKNPVARRYGFHKSSLSRLCGDLKIEYVHIAELGIASSLRRNLNTHSDRERLFKHYEVTTLVTEKTAIERVATMMQNCPSALVCMEAEPCYCHRSRLAKVVSERTALPIKHLKVGSIL
ncbi:DUF488 domain-containing protein [Candidatus Sumerlaeota bacterium]|nr:DUF488 domain-containing protein [Candidatus Sumerlaeota bacterium]